MPAKLTHLCLTVNRIWKDIGNRYATRPYLEGNGGLRHVSDAPGLTGLTSRPVVEMKQYGVGLVARSSPVVDGPQYYIRAHVDVALRNRAVVTNKPRSVSRNLMARRKLLQDMRFIMQGAKHRRTAGTRNKTVRDLREPRRSSISLTPPRKPAEKARADDHESHTCPLLNACIPTRTLDKTVSKISF